MKIGILRTALISGLFCASMFGARSAMAQCTQNVSDLNVMSFAYEAMMAIHNYSFVNYDKTLSYEKAGQYLSQQAWQTYSEELKTSGVLARLIKNKWVSTVGTANAPIILRKGMREGQHQWLVQIPLLIHYQSAEEDTINTRVEKLLIVQDENHCLKVANINTVQEEKQL